jgi:S1-C subfamily serine protease
MTAMHKTWSIALGGALLVALAPVPALAQREGLKGWVGVAYTTSGETDRGGRLVFDDYPVIESIEPGSPAERAGLAAGDTILAMNSQDLRRSPLPMAAMIQPGQRIVFRFRRNDSVREVTVTVAPRPTGTSERLSLTLIEQGAAAAGERGNGLAPAAVRTPLPPGRGDRGRVEIRSRIPGPPAVTIAPLVFGFGPRTLGVAGAELTGLNADLGSAVGISSRGIFVVNVALGTPAKESGLRPGDVIIKADASPVSDPGELIRVMRAATDNSIRLQIVRRKKPQTITLRW